MSIESKMGGAALSGQNDARKQAFAHRLNTLMNEKDLTPKQVVSRMEAELHGEKFSGVNLAHYRAGRSLPRPRYLNALSAAIGVPPATLLRPEDVLERSGAGVLGNDALPEMRIEEVSPGEAYLQLNRRLPWAIVLRVLEAVKMADPAIAAGAR